jgi:hypothetical protein
MSTVHCNTIQTSSGGPVTLTKQSAAKVWTVMAQNVIQDSLNTSGTTDTGTGRYVVAFSSNMSSAEYSLTGGSYRLENNRSPGMAGFETPTTSQYEINYFTSSFALGDMFRCYQKAHGDLA